ncbi:PIN domain-containing protein [Acidianus hospitalis]|uniref:PIN domain-containing protein n=1 Tax=Acidianus hospitalis TaxID=563177 RepID=A0A2T9X3N0_9CREN|nr:type II toxin-antitoxin system VapC family toxin [Acidianus sp.]PVU74687.1 PIN domain-containing protein [Acidianus hospitalis]
MGIVVDGTLLSAVILKESNWERLAELIPNSSTLDVAVMETLNAISNAKKKKVIDEEVANKLFEALNEFANAMKVYESKYYLEKAFKLAIKYGINTYSALYLALAEDLNLSLATLDAKQAKVASKMGIEVINIK